MWSCSKRSADELSEAAAQLNECSSQLQAIRGEINAAPEALRTAARQTHDQLALVLAWPCGLQQAASV
jgi:hypothetical protein